MRLDELSFEIRLERRTTKGSSSGRITVRLVPVFIPEIHNPHLPVVPFPRATKEIGDVYTQAKPRRTAPGGGTSGITGWGCAAGTLEPLTYTRAEFCYPVLE